MENQEVDINFKWTKKKLSVLVLIILVVSCFGVGGLLLYREYKKQGLGEISYKKKAPSDFKDYKNDYWGVELKYPGSWNQVIGSYADGEYYFSSEPINFINELSQGEAIIALKTYNNWQDLNFEDWLADQEKKYFPRGTIVTKEPSNYDQFQAKHYVIELSHAQNNTAIWDFVVISRDQKTKYMLILETADKKSHDKFNSDYQKTLHSLNFIDGYGIK